MKPEELKAADKIIMMANGFGVTPEDISGQGVGIMDAQNAAAYLKDEGLISIQEKGGWHDVYKLTGEGIKLRDSRKKYRDYLAEKEVRLQAKAEKDKKDEKHKDLQIQDLEMKLKVMNEAQLDFWKSQKQKNVQTTLIAIISAVFAFVAMLKSFGIL